MKFKNKRVLVYGLGESGRAVIKLLQKDGAKVSFYDDNIKFYEYVGFERHPAEKDFDFVVVSPGIKVLGNKLLEHFYAKKTCVMSELDFAYLHCKGKVVAITGTNGKTTVSMLTNKILREAGFKTFLCGNVGLPFSSICDKTTSKSVVVCEVSNFQLETTRFFKADVACVLNIKPDHLDRHGSFEEYVATKAKLISALKPNGQLILNLDDQETKKLARRNCSFFSKNFIKRGTFSDRNQIFVNKKPMVSLNSVTLKGEKNLENVLAAISICSKFKVTDRYFEKALSSFSPAMHRMQVVGTIDGVTYIDDSKATNVASTIACVEAFRDKNIVLLMGGQGKNIDYGELFKLNFNIKQVVCFGSEADNIFKVAKNFGYFATAFSTLKEATLFCKENARVGDYVLLSPACSSFDEFSNYAERGERFKEIVLENIK